MSDADDPFREWAENAAKLRFGPYVVLQSDKVGKLIFHEPPAGTHPYFSMLLGSGKTWQEAVETAIRYNPDFPQPPMEPLAETIPDEEFIEEFCQAMRRRDLPSEFLLWYGSRSDADPAGYPRSMPRQEWLEFMAMFLAGFED